MFWNFNSTNNTIAETFNFMLDNNIDIAIFGPNYKTYQNNRIRPNHYTDTVALVAGWH